MSRIHLPLLLLVLLLSAGALVQAQTAAPARPKAAEPASAGGKVSTLGAPKGSGKLLTRDELRVCLKQQSDLAARKPQLDADRSTLDRERQELLQVDEALKTERAAMDRLAETAAALNRRTKEYSALVVDFNDRVTKFEESSRSGPTAERQRRDFEREKKALDSSAQALEAERAALGPNAEQMMKTYNARSATRDQAAAEWNTRNARLTQGMQGYQVELETWSNDCAGRSYREDDEKAILSGN